MQTQHISDIYPNVISITSIREDIHNLLGLLERYPEVKVLRGQKVLFNAVRPGIEKNQFEKIKKAAAYFKTAAGIKGRKTKISATEWLIVDREKMRLNKYYS
jgi:hypothetical protein